MDILNSERKKSKKHDYGLLFIPRNIISNRELVDIVKSEYLFKLKGNYSQRIGVVALTRIENSRNTADVAEIKLVITIFCTAGG